MSMIALLAVSALLATVVSALVQRLALRFGIIDRPELAPQRKRVGRVVPLLGGLAIWFTLVVVTSLLFPNLTQGYLLPKHLFGLWLAGGVLMLGGWWDDRKNLSPQVQLIFPVVACVLVVASGIGIDYISNPFPSLGGGVITLEQIRWTLFYAGGLPYQITLWADLFTIVWLMLSMYTTKLLDGVDGLVSGIGMIGGIIIGLLSLSVTVVQPETASVAFIFAGACAGFLVWNFAPARLYLGEGGALFIGFMLGVLAILSGSKIATALLILGLPLLDVLAVILRRMVIERKSPWHGDLLHLHFQLQQRGWSVRQIVLVYYIITLSFGLSTLILHGPAKVLVLGVLVLCGLALVIYASFNSTRHH